MYHIIKTVFTVFPAFSVIVTATSVISLPASCPKECPLRSLYAHATIVIDKAGDESAFYKNCILKCARTQVAIANDMRTFMKHDAAFLKQISEGNPLIIFLNRINARSSLYALIKETKRDPWSILFMIFLREGKRIPCKDFTSHEAFIEVKQLFSYLWRKLYAINVIAFFPLICPNKYITYGNKYYNDSRDTYDRMIDLFSGESVLNKLLNKSSPLAMNLMRDFPLRASIFYRFPTSIKECENMKYYLVLKREYSDGYCGLDGLIMAEIISKFRFNLTLNRSKGVQNYGYVTRERRITGTLGCITRDEDDLAFNSRFLADYGTTGFHFLVHTSSDALCALVNRPEEIPLWLFPYKHAYDNYVILLIIFSFVIVGLFLWTMQRFSRTTKREHTLKLHEMVLDAMLAGTFGFSVKPHKISYILKASCFFSSTIFMATFQGHVNYAFTTVKFNDDIKTLQDLYDSGLVIATSPSIKTLIEPPYNELQSALIDRMAIGKGNRTLQEIFSDKRHAALERRTDILIEIQKYHTDEHGKPLFNVVEECFRTYYLSIIARVEFPFTEHIKVVLDRLQAAGLPAKYYEWTRHSLGISRPTQVSGIPTPRPATPVSLAELRIGFSVLFTGYIVSCLALIIERRQCSY